LRHVPQNSEKDLMMIPISPQLVPSIAINPQREPPPAPVGHANLREAAEAFEAVFLTEMLGHSGVGGAAELGDGEFAGGAGEDAFSSLLTREWAVKLSAQGGIGLSDAIFRALLAREN
jgi:Rod binding domain-containing protein